MCRLFHANYSLEIKGFMNCKKFHFWACVQFVWILKDCRYIPVQMGISATKGPWMSISRGCKNGLRLTCFKYIITVSKSDLQIRHCLKAQIFFQVLLSKCLRSRLNTDANNAKHLLQSGLEIIGPGHVLCVCVPVRCRLQCWAAAGSCWPPSWPPPDTAPSDLRPHTPAWGAPADCSRSPPGAWFYDRASSGSWDETQWGEVMFLVQHDFFYSAFSSSISSFCAVWCGVSESDVLQPRGLVRDPQTDLTVKPAGSTQGRVQRVRTVSGSNNQHLSRFW